MTAHPPALESAEGPSVSPDLPSPLRGGVGGGGPLTSASRSTTPTRLPPPAPQGGGAPGFDVCSKNQPRNSAPHDHQVAIVGAGLAGTLAAIALARAGISVALIEREPQTPPAFRVEKIGGDQIAKMRRLGVLDALEAEATRFEEIANLRRGRLLDRTRAPHYGIFYDRLVATMRRQLPASVRFVAGRAEGIANGPGLQTVAIAGQAPLTARLVVLATGMGDVLRSRLGIEREVIAARQSLTFGFNLALAGGGRFIAPAFTYYGERTEDGIDYLNIFPAGGITRANLFTFRDHRDPLVKALRADPAAVLARTLPGLVPAIGAFSVTSKVETWLMDLSVASEPAIDGVVLIGDAFQTSCPAAGTGVSRLLTDVERLARVHVPAWLETEGMPASKIAAFYADPEKRAMDAHALALAHYRRSLTLEQAPAWWARRQGLVVRRRLVHALDRLSPGLVASLRALKARPA